MKLNIINKCEFEKKEIYKCANTRLGWYRENGLDVVIFLLSPTVLGIRKGNRPGLVHLLNYYLKNL